MLASLVMAAPSTKYGGMERDPEATSAHGGAAVRRLRLGASGNLDRGLYPVRGAREPWRDDAIESTGCRSGGTRRRARTIAGDWLRRRGSAPRAVAHDPPADRRGPAHTRAPSARDDGARRADPRRALQRRAAGAARREPRDGPAREPRSARRARARA